LASTLVAPVFTVPLSLLFNRFSAKLTALRSSYLVPILLVLCLLGTYAVRLYIFDIYMTLFFGLLGLLMRKYRYPVIPFILGIILGPIAEHNLFRTTRLASGGDLSIFFSTTGNVLIVILIALLFFGFIWPMFKKNPKNMEFSS
jgi:putative tricarboxylic transport membrane protein